MSASSGKVNHTDSVTASPTKSASPWSNSTIIGIGTTKSGSEASLFPDTMRKRFWNTIRTMLFRWMEGVQTGRSLPHPCGKSSPGSGRNSALHHNLIRNICDGFPSGNMKFRNKMPPFFSITRREAPLVCLQEIRTSRSPRRRACPSASRRISVA